MIHQWPLSQPIGDTPVVFSRLLSTIAGNVSFLATPRQFFPDVTLDVPTLMALVVVFTFLIQFYFTVVSLNLAAVASASSLPPSSSTFSTTTTATSIFTQEETVSSPIRTQMVTPAPAPDWRFLPHRVVRRSLDFSPGQDRSAWPQPLQPWNTLHYLELARRSSGRPQVVPYEAVSNSVGTSEERLTSQRRMSLLYEIEEGGSSGEMHGSLNPLTLSSHRVDVSHENTEDIKTNAAGLVSSVLYGAERWSNRLEEWNILSPDGAHALTQVLLMVRCAFINPNFCAKLDHYFRRQHDLNLAAAMMNDYDHDDHIAIPDGAEQPDISLSEEMSGMEKHDAAEVDREVLNTGRVENPIRLDKDGNRKGLRKELEAQGKIGTVSLVDHLKVSNLPVGAPGGVGRLDKLSLPSIRRPQVSLIERNGKLRVTGPGSSGTALASKKTWGVYVIVTLAAAILLVMEAAHRILQLVARPGRALHSPYQDPLDALTAALHRWHDRDDL